MSASAALTQGMAQLAAIVGEKHARLLGETAQTIEVAHGEMQQVAEILRVAHANALSVMPGGGGTKLGWGNTFTADIELSMKRLNQLREHAWQDMTCTVQAGCSWTAMQGALKTHGQMVALDPLFPERATVGGIVACNDSGALRLKYGGFSVLLTGDSEETERAWWLRNDPSLARNCTILKLRSEDTRLNSSHLARSRMPSSA